MNDTYDGRTAREWATDYYAATEAYQAALKRIYDRQQRDKAAWSDEWRTTVDGQRGAIHHHATYADAAADVERFGYRKVQHRRTTGWRDINPADPTST